MVLHDSVTATEKMGDITGAYQYRGKKYVTFTIVQNPGGYYRSGDNQRYACLKTEGTAARYHALLNDRMTNAPLPLTRLPDYVGSSPAKQTAENTGSKDTVFWWREPNEFKAYVLYYGAQEWIEVQLGWDKYIPVSQYPKLIVLTPFALIGDILTFPFVFMMPRIDG